MPPPRTYDLRPAQCLCTSASAPEAKHQRLTELQSKESERMQKFKEEMGLQGVTQKIQIAPRQD